MSDTTENKEEKEVLNKEEVQEQEAQTTNEEEKTEVEEISLEDQLAGEKDKFLRLFAEFENYKRRTSKERIELYKTANQELMTVLLPILDDFDRALAEIKKSGEEELVKGVELINSKFISVLNQKGLASVEAAAGDDFDADIHDAITQIPAPSEDLKGKLIDVVEKGFKLGDKIIRHPKVVVGQ